MPADIKAIQKVLGDYYAATRSLDVNQWLDTFAPDAIACEPVGSTPLENREARYEFFLGISDYFETVGLTEEFVKVIDNEAAVKWRGQGVGKTGKTVTFEGIDVFEFNNNAQITSVRAYWDPLAVIAELQATLQSV